MKKNIYLLILSLALFMPLFSCKTVPVKLEPNMEEEIFFKNAQEAMDQNNYTLALYYYDVYLVRYPENHQKTIGAEYERAFIYYKMKDYDYSKKLFNQILDEYDNSPFAVMFPERFKILSQKVLEKIDDIQNPQKNKDKKNNGNEVPSQDDQQS